MEVYAQLLGAPQLRFADTSYDPPPSKVSALLYYLAYREAWCSRDELLYLFYPDTAESSARRNLRQLLTSIRRLPYSEGLVIEAKRLYWPVATDVQEFKRAVGAKQWSKAVERYQGDLLKGVTLFTAPEFESWLELERAELHHAWRDAALSLATECESAERYGEAVELLSKLYRSDPLDEAVLRRYLIALNRRGERSEALHRFRLFTRLLQEEVGGEPEAATQDLIKSIQRGESLEPQEVVAVQNTSRVLTRPGPPMPPQATPFIGRTHERTSLALELGDPTCRLVTIVGSGGMGKTRLALEVATDQQKMFHNGVFFVPFEAVTSVEGMVSTLASALDLSSISRADPKQHVLDYLQDKNMLLVFDNLEHLLENTALITDILTFAPGIKILATSRETLGLHAEWVFELEGMSYPEASLFPLPGETAEPSGAEDHQCYDAVQLFLQAARQARAGFTFEASNRQAIVRTCQLVEGMPLALELAASWLRLLSATEIVGQLEVGIDLLEAPIRDVPARHKSVRATFELSWKLLLPREQEVLRKLCVFRGGFTLEAAKAVADASLPLLLALVNKTFLRRNHTGRFSQHPLVWQFVTERSQDYPEERRQTEERHSGYFAEFLQARENTRYTTRGSTAFQEIAADIENVEAAWRFAARHCNEHRLNAAGLSLFLFYSSTSWVERGLQTMRYAQQYSTDGSLLYGRLLGWIGDYMGDQGRLEEGIALVEKGLAVLEGQPSREALALHLRILGTMYGELGGTYHQNCVDAYQRALSIYRELGDAEGIAMMLSNFASDERDVQRALQLLDESVHLSRSVDSVYTLALALSSLAALLHYRKGDYAGAKKAIEESLVHFEEAGNVFYRSLSLIQRARILTAMGDLQAAEDQCQALLKLCEVLEPTVAAQLRGETHSVLGHLAYLQGDLLKATTLYEASFTHGNSFNLQRVTARSSLDLARISVAQCDSDNAEAWLHKAWKKLKSHTMGFNSELSASKIRCLSLFGELAALQGDDRKSWNRFGEALCLAQEWDYTPAALEVLAGTANLLVRHEERRDAALLLFVAEHPASTWETKAGAQKVLSSLAPEVLAETSSGERLQLHDAVSEVLAGVTKKD